MDDVRHIGFTLLLAGIFIIPLAFIARATVRRAVEARRSRTRIGILIVTALVGLVIGFWLGFGFDYQPSETIRVVGCPLPIVFFGLEGDRWTDFVVPVPILNGMLNVVIVALFVLAPLHLAFRTRT